MMDDSFETYLREVLTLDPADEADALLARRAEQLGTPPMSTGPKPPPDHRHGLLRLLSDLAQRIWDLEPKEIQCATDGLNFGPHVDLERFRNRLIRVAAHRAEFAVFSQPDHVPAQLKGAIQSVLSALPSAAAQQREKILGELWTEGDYAKWQSGVENIRTYAPGLADIERDFLDQILRVLELRVMRR